MKVKGQHGEFGWVRSPIPQPVSMRQVEIEENERISIRVMNKLTGKEEEILGYFMPGVLTLSWCKDAVIDAEGLAIVYKEFYNKDRGMLEPVWGDPVEGLQCPTCGSQDMYASAHPNDPEEIIGNETVRCGHCGQITDYFEACKQRQTHPTETPRLVAGGPA